MQRLDAVENAIDNVFDRLSALENATTTIAESVSELVRTPSFIEYRARAKAKNITQQPGESDLQFLLRLAKSYYARYRAWPDPSDTNRFGAFPATAKPEQWPKAPPAQ